MKSVVLFGSLFDQLVEKITNGTKKKIDSIILECSFKNCGEFFAEFENNSSDDDLQMVFSEFNLASIYSNLKQNKGFDYNTILRRRLGSIFKEYGISGGIFIDAFINAFNTCIYEYDKDLYKEIYIGDFREEVNESLNEIKNELAIIHNSIDVNKNIELNINNDNNNNSSDNILEWNISYYSIKGIWGNTGIDDLKELTKHWEKERISYPGWYIAPYNKRQLLKSYTNNSELLYMVKDVVLNDMFDFAFELVWRYETGFIVYDNRLISQLEFIWDSAYKELISINISDYDKSLIQKWFFIGQVLLREYREDLKIDEWNNVYNLLNQFHNVFEKGKIELFLEKLKMQFMQNKLSAVKECLYNYNFDNDFESYIQIASLKAEFGLCEDAYQDLCSLEKILIINIDKELNKLNLVRLKSILAVTYYLLFYIYKSLNPFINEDDTLDSLRKNMNQYSMYFDFDNEKTKFKLAHYDLSKKKDKSTPFELNRETKVIFGSSYNVAPSYDFYRLLDRISIPLNIGYIRLLDEYEPDFLLNLITCFNYIGWFTLLRIGSIKSNDKTIDRKECICLANVSIERYEKIFDYIYSAIDNNLPDISNSINVSHSNTYSHILYNGMALLYRLGSISSIYNQKRLVYLMNKLIEMRVVREYGVLNNWIKQIMLYLDERTKSDLINELLRSSVSKRNYIMDGEKELDPFDVLFVKDNAIHIYKKAVIDPDIVDKMLAYSKTCNAAEKKHYISRIGQLYEWGLLNKEQIEEFSIILWENYDNDNLPYSEDYYYSVFLRWPHPDNIDSISVIKKKLLDEKNMKDLCNLDLAVCTFRESRFLSEIRAINSTNYEFWSKEDMNLLIKGFVDYWNTISASWDAISNDSYHYEEINDRVKALIFTMHSFSNKLFELIDESVRNEYRDMVMDMKNKGVESLELECFLASSDKDLNSLVERVIKSLESYNNRVVDSAINASDYIFDVYPNSKYSKKIFVELIQICKYGKPGSKKALILLHNYLYRGNVELTNDIYTMACDALKYANNRTCYNNIVDKTDSEIKEIIKQREACANFAYQLYCYEANNFDKHSDETLLWKDICRGNRSIKEFNEVKKCWLE